MSRLPSLPLAVAAALALAAPSPTTVTVKGVPAACPAKYDRSYVTKFGPSSARAVLVLVPAYAGGAGDFSLPAEDLVERVSGTRPRISSSG